MKNPEKDLALWGIRKCENTKIPRDSQTDRQMATLCNLTLQKLEQNGVSVLGNCPVEGCGLPVARHRDETAPTTSGKPQYLSFYLMNWSSSLSSVSLCLFLFI
jgi:hypothetical protein